MDGPGVMYVCLRVRLQNKDVELWSTKDDDRVVGDVWQGNGVVKQFSEEV